MNPDGIQTSCKISEYLSKLDHIRAYDQIPVEPEHFSKLQQQTFRIAWIIACPILIHADGFLQTLHGLEVMDYGSDLGTGEQGSNSCRVIYIHLRAW